MKSWQEIELEEDMAMLKTCGKIMRGLEQELDFYRDRITKWNESNPHEQPRIESPLATIINDAVEKYSFQHALAHNRVESAKNQSDPARTCVSLHSFKYNHPLPPPCNPPPSQENDGGDEMEGGEVAESSPEE